MRLIRCSNCKWYENAICTNHRSIHEHFRMRRYDRCDKWDEAIDGNDCDCRKDDK